jgi:hypothetical protein
MAHGVPVQGRGHEKGAAAGIVPFQPRQPIRRARLRRRPRPGRPVRVCRRRRARDDTSALAGRSTSVTGSGRCFGLPVFGFLPETSKACASPTPIAIACTVRRRTQPDARHAGTTWRRVQTVIASNIASVIDAAAVRVCGATGRVDWVKQVDGHRTDAEAFVLMTRGCRTCAKVMLVETPRKSSQRMCHRRVRRAPSKACRRCVSQASP